MSRTLAEAAMEVLNGTRSSAPKEGMHKLDNTGSQLDGVVDLGGASFEDPQGGDIGKKAAAAAPSATPPGVKPDAGDRSKSLKQASDATASGTNDVTLDQSLAKQTKAAPKMQPTSEETETTDEDEEVIEEENAEENADEAEEELTEEEVEAARVARWEEMKERMKKHSVKEDIDALFSGETLSEEFKQKATIIFETAVLTRAVTVAEELEKEILTAAEESIAETRAELEEQIEDYLNLVVQEWIQENTVAIESGLKSEIVEDFIAGLKNLFVEHYVDVPEEKVDVIEAQSAEIAALTAKVNEALNANVELNKKFNESKKKEILTSVCEGLTATQAEKIKALTESLEFTTESDYTKKVKVIRESYTSGKVKVEGTSVVALTEGAGPAEIVEEETISPMMKSFVQAISRTQK